MGINWVVEVIQNGKKKYVQAYKNRTVLKEEPWKATHFKDYKEAQSYCDASLYPNASEAEIYRAGLSLGECKWLLMNLLDMEVLKRVGVTKMYACGCISDAPKFGVREIEDEAWDLFFDRKGQHSLMEQYLEKKSEEAVKNGETRFLVYRRKR